MKRRNFIAETGRYLAGMTILRSVSLGERPKVGGVITTTDILGPFYRPGAPNRININPPGFTGDILDLSGTIYTEDGRTPFKYATVEIWQCNPNQLYDNVSDDFWYRGTQNIS